MTKFAYNNSLIKYSLSFIFFLLLSSQAFGIFGLFEDDISDAEKSQKFRKDYVFVYVYSSKCGYCYKFSPILKRFVNKNKITVKSFTTNGGKIKGFENARQSPKLVSKYDFSGYPALFAENKKTGYVYKIAEGYMSRSELNNRYANLLDSIY